MHIDSLSGARTASCNAMLQSIHALFAVFAMVLLPDAHAAPPQVKTQAPGFYRMMLGDFEITALSDGTAKLPVDQLLTNVKPDQLRILLGREHLQSPVETSINSFLINTGAKLVLVDTGVGTTAEFAGTKLLANLKAAGYQPEQVDVVLITHMHGDHVGGLAVNGQRSFPNAVVRMDKHEVDYWLSPANLEKAKAEGKSSFQRAMSALEPYSAAGKIQSFEGGAEIVAGITAIATPGHTPGHSVYSVESKGEKLVLWGDLMHVAAVQFPEPSVTIQFDVDSKAAQAQRQKAFADAAAQGYLVGIAHVSFPGLGHVRADGKGYAWVPANYSANP